MTPTFHYKNRTCEIMLACLIYITVIHIWWRTSNSCRRQKSDKILTSLVTGEMQTKPPWDNYKPSYIIKVVNQPHIKLVKVKVTQSCLTLWDPMDYTVHGILQARILEQVAVSFSRASSQPGDWTQVSRITGRFFTIWATREAHIKLVGGLKDKSSKIIFIHRK